MTGFLYHTDEVESKLLYNYDSGNNFNLKPEIEKWLYESNIDYLNSNEYRSIYFMNEEDFTAFKMMFL